MNSVFGGNTLFGWQVKNMVSGAANAPGAAEQLLTLMDQAKLRTIFFKVADGAYQYNLSPIMVGPVRTGWRDDILPAIFAALTAARRKKIGWHYLYGYQPEAEAERAHQRITQFKLDGYVWDPESEYKGYPDRARRFVQRFRALQPDIPVALCSFRYPLKYHADFPWKEFLAGMDAGRGDVLMPQVYWEQDFRPYGGAEQVLASYVDYGRAPFASKKLDFIPVAPLYKSGGWQPTKEQLDLAKTKAREMNLAGFSYWALDDMLLALDGQPNLDKGRGYWMSVRKDADYWNGATPPAPPPTEVLSLESLDRRVSALEKYHQS